MPKIFGGMLLQNLLNQDKYFNLQMKLFERDLINGVQLGVPHPDLVATDSLAILSKKLKNLPDKFKFFIHILGENGGFNLGQNLDEKNVYQQYGKNRNISWHDWNKQMFNFGLQIFSLFNKRHIILDCAGVIHPGYAKSSKDLNSFWKIVKFLKSIAGPLVALETVPAWDMTHKFWGLGGTPKSMKGLLESLPGFKVLLDFSHLWITHNQSFAPRELFNLPELRACQDLSKMVETYLAFPRLDICHFSGIAPKGTLSDTHNYIGNKIPRQILEAMKLMKVICIEINYYPDNPEQDIRGIEKFINQLKN
jgi:hypothetical protein